jgi:hypothetical protein
MNLLDILTVGSKILDRVLPDPAARIAAQQKLMELQQNGELAELNAELQTRLGQIEVNKIEASSESIFKAGWRPFIGWVCGFALAYEFIVRVIAGYIFGNWLGWMEPPQLDMGDLMTILGGILGLGSLRTYEKKTGVHKK